LLKKSHVFLLKNTLFLKKKPVKLRKSSQNWEKNISFSNYKHVGRFWRKCRDIFWKMSGDFWKMSGGFEENLRWFFENVGWFQTKMSNNFM